MKFIAVQAITVCVAAYFSLFLLGATHANAPVPAGLSAPQPLPDARLSGSGTLRFLGISMYEARLWVRPGFDAQNYAAQPFALELRYARGFSADAIASRSINEMRRQQTFSDAQAARWQAALATALPAVQAGDQVIGLHTPAGEARFWHNGVETGHIDDPLFSRLFFGIWLSPQSSEPALRAALLAQP